MNTPVPTAASVAEALLKTLVSMLGVPMVADLVDIATETTPGQVIEDISLLGMAVVQAALDVLEPDAVRAIVKAGYAAADAQADALENAKFPQGGGD